MPKAKNNGKEKRKNFDTVYFIEITKHLRAMMTTTITIFIIALSTGAITINTVFMKDKYSYLEFCFTRKKIFVEIKKKYLTVD